VHRFLLARDGSAFENMFTLPSDRGTSPQGLSDDHPIVLYDDEDEFRALCWALYALYVSNFVVEIDGRSQTYFPITVRRTSSTSVQRQA
jgi:hypothetical protein